MLVKNNHGETIVRCGQTILSQAYYNIGAYELFTWQNDDVVLSEIALGALIVNDGIEDLGASEGLSFLKSYKKQNPKTPDYRDIVAINRIPAGYTVYPAGKGDSLTSGGYRLGNTLTLDADNKIKRFQLLNHWYGIGGKAVWQGADLDDYISIFLKAPATVGVNAAGDFVKVNIGGPLNVFVPVEIGTGTWAINLNEKHTGTNVLKCVPVPSSGNTGFFDYNSDTNILTVNSTQTGGYNLYDFEATLFCFGSHVWGRKIDGSESSVEVTDVVGKLLFNSWVIDVVLTTTKMSGIKVGMNIISAVKGNV